jgi:hypothetical protein
MDDATIESLTSRSRPFERAPASLAERAAVRLRGEVRRVDALSARETEAMYALMRDYFDGVSREVFARDLREKEWAVLLADDGGRLRGFSTMMRYDATAGDERVAAIFSGDTIVERDCWGETLLPRLWSQHAFRVAESIRDVRTYWFLICSGYKTYRFLPVFFREFYPTYERETPARERSILDALGRARYPGEYDAGAGLVRLAAPAPLQAGVADLTEARMRDPHVAFFARVNPGHERGDELACLTELVPSNLTPAGRRMVGPEIAGR